MDDKFVEMALLYDFYSGVLTLKQRQMVELYYMKDYSLSEIGELIGISRQAVHDNIKRAKKQLFAMEESLGLMKRFRKECKGRADALERLNDIIRILKEELDQRELAGELRIVAEHIKEYMAY